LDGLTSRPQGDGLPIVSAPATYAYDDNGNMTNDPRKNLDFAYNSLNLVQQVTRNSAVRATYLYAADGRKLRVRDGAGASGYDYLGNLTLVKTPQTTTAEAAFAEGVIRSNGITFFEKDHIGSVRATVTGSSAPIYADYTPFGVRHSGSGIQIDPNNRFWFNGKEEQTTGTLALLDYGARMYDFERWMTIDPLAEKYYAISPYAFTLNNPVKYVDPYGLWSETATSYFTDDPTDIQRFTDFQRIYSDYGLNASMGEMRQFVQWEMNGGSSGGAGGIYPSSTLGSNLFLNPAQVTNRSGQWTWDEDNRQQIYANQKAFVEQGNFYYSPPFSDILIGMGFDLSSMGGNLGWLGAAFTLTGKGAVIGVPMMKIGGAMGTAGGYLRGIGYGIQRRTPLAVYTIALTSITWGLSEIVGYGARQAKVGQRAMLTPYVLMNVVNSLIEQGEIQMLQNSITLTK
jgi:RHS repeat-associated protein